MVAEFAQNLTLGVLLVVFPTSAVFLSGLVIVLIGISMLGLVAQIRQVRHARS
jgi:hypothetical protein